MVILKAKQSFLTMQYSVITTSPLYLKQDTVPRPFWIVITAERRMKNI